MFNRDESEVAGSSIFRRVEKDVLPCGGGVVTGADDCAVVRDEVEGTRIPGLPGVVEKLTKDPNESSC